MDIQVNSTEQIDTCLSETPNLSHLCLNSTSLATVFTRMTSQTFALLSKLQTLLFFWFTFRDPTCFENFQYLRSLKYLNFNECRFVDTPKTMSSLGSVLHYLPNFTHLFFEKLMPTRGEYNPEQYAKGFDELAREFTDRKLGHFKAFLDTTHPTYLEAYETGTRHPFLAFVERAEDKQNGEKSELLKDYVDTLVVIHPELGMVVNGDVDWFVERYETDRSSLIAE